MRRHFTEHIHSSTDTIVMLTDEIVYGRSALDQTVHDLRTGEGNGG